MITTLPGMPQAQPRAATRRRAHRRGAITALLALATLVSVAAPGQTQPAEAATTFTLNSLTATVNGQSVTATANVKASTATAASQYGICVRTNSRSNADFALQSSVTLSTTGTAYSRTKTFPDGAYHYYACVKTSSGWHIVGNGKDFVVGGNAPAPMPVGNLPGWKQVFTDDFNTNVPMGSFVGASKSRYLAYSGYNDTGKQGTYNPDKVLSVKDGALDWYLHTADGKHNVAAVVPRVPATGWGQKYGRYSVRFRSDVMLGYKVAMLLWPDSDNWGEGEIDFAEAGALTPGAKLYANMYERGNPATRTPGRSIGFTTNTSPAASGWHVATVEWSPNNVTYMLDGVTLGTLRNNVPNTPMHMVMQVEARVDGVPVPDSTRGHLQVDWVTMYSYAP